VGGPEGLALSFQQAESQNDPGQAIRKKEKGKLRNPQLPLGIMIADREDFATSFLTLSRLHKSVPYAHSGAGVLRSASLRAGCGCQFS